MKKALFILLIITLTLAAFCSCDTGSNESDIGTNIETPENVSYYTKDDGTYLAVVSGKSEITSFHITATRNGKPVTEVLIENNVTRIPADALIECVYLKHLSIGYDTKSIDKGAFSNLSSLESLTFYPLGSGYSLSNLFAKGSPSTQDNMPNTFKTVRIAEGVQEIPAYTFEGCTTLTNITIPNSVTEIGDCAFKNCENLAAVSLPDSVTWIGNDAFSGCNALTYNEYSNGYYVGNARNPYIALAKAKNIELTEFEIHVDTKLILDRAFENFTYLSRITIPEGVTRIGKTAFAGCFGITFYCEAENPPLGDWRGNTPTILNCREYDRAGDGYTYLTIDGIKYALSGRIAIVVRQPNGITEARIANFIELNEVTYRVDAIEDHAFKNCTTLTSVAFPRSVPYDHIGIGAFNNCTSLTDVTLPDGLTRIYDNTFTGCESLTDVTIPEGITAIEKYAFAGCKSLTSLTLPEGLTHIYDYAFDGCEALTSLSLPESLTNVSCGAFGGCQSLPLTEYRGALYLGSTANPYLCLVSAVNTEIIECTVNDAAKIIQGGAFDGCAALTNVTISASVITIGDNAFHNCEKLKSVIIPNGVAYVGLYVFDGCTSLDKIYCEAAYKPYAWAEYWNVSGSAHIMTVWGYRSY